MLNLPPPLDKLNIQPPLSEAYTYQRGVIDGNSRWFPLLSVKGYEVYNSYKRNILACGSRKSGKTLGIGNRFMRHLWEVDGAVGGVVAKTAKNAKIGVWRDIRQFVLPGWIQANFGLKVIKHGTDPATKMEYIILRNMHGGESELQLHSLDYEFDVEEKFKSSRFSIIWLSEADQFCDRIVYDILEDQLRVVGIPFEQHHFIFDCNPPQEGDEHWLHDLFFKAADENSDKHIKNHHERYQAFQFGLDDNPFLDPREKENLIAKYQHDPVKYARFVEGKWVKDTTAGHFDDVFLYNVHVVGKADSPRPDDWETLAPAEHSVQLITGTDMGDLNHATSFISLRVNEQDEVCYDIFDEICSIGNKLSVEDFAGMVWDRVNLWNKWYKDTYNHEPPPWRHWADSSLWNYSATANNNDAQIFYDVSDGKLLLNPVLKGKGSIRQRIAMCKRLLFANRLLISAHCRWNVGWCRYLRPGRAKNEPIQAGNEFRHQFDATSYAIGSEVPYEMGWSQEPTKATGMVVIR